MFMLFQNNDVFEFLRLNLTLLEIVQLILPMFSKVRFSKVFTFIKNSTNVYNLVFFYFIIHFPIMNIFETEYMKLSVKKKNS